MATVPPLTDETPLDQYTATASQTDFTFTFMIFATADIKVYVNDVLQVETTDYVVKQADLSPIIPADDLPMDGGKVVFNTGLTLDDAVTLSREIPIDRLTGYSVAGAFRADVLNAELARMQAINQQFERDLARTVRLSASDAEAGSLVLPADRANNFLAFDVDGNMIASAGSADGAVVSTFMATVLDDVDAAAVRGTLAVQQDVVTTRGDVVRGSSSGVAERLALGSANQVLQSNGTDLVWGAYVSASDTQEGISERATQLEVDAWSDNSRFVTAKTLADRKTPVFRAYLGAQQIINGSTETKLNMDSESFDSEGWYDDTTNYRYTPLKAGYYHFNVQVFMTGSNTNRAEVRLFKNGSQYSRGDSGGFIDDMGFGFSDIIYLDGNTDYVEVYLIHYSAAAKTVLQGENNSFWNAHLIF